MFWQVLELWRGESIKQQFLSLTRKARSEDGDARSIIVWVQ